MNEYITKIISLLLSPKTNESPGQENMDKLVIV